MTLFRFQNCYLKFFRENPSKSKFGPSKWLDRNQFLCYIEKIIPSLLTDHYLKVKPKLTVEKTRSKTNFETGFIKEV